MRPKVLLVDDDRGVQSAWKLQLEDLGHKVEVIQAFTAEEARAMFRAHADLAAIVMDGYLSDSERDPAGVGLTREFRGSFTGPMIAASSDSRVRKMLGRAGCDHEAERKVYVPRLLLGALKLQ
ncbi:MAG: response regulator [Parcubacteria group bacterium]|nr:response regulator [Parcubacteria group bacterium]